MGSLRLGTSTAGQETARGVLRGQRRRRGHLLTTPLCLMGPVWAFFLFIALGKLRLMRNFDLPESCRKSTLVWNLGLPHVSATFSHIPRPSRAIEKERVHFVLHCAALVRGGTRNLRENGNCGEIGQVSRVLRPTLLGAPSPTPVGPGTPQ